MNLFFLTFLFIFGTLFGSFASVVIYRIKSGEAGILTGRSHCGSCNKLLKALDLIPIISYLKNRGKCNYCKSKVSSVYMCLEVASGILFSLIGYFLIDIPLLLSGDILEILKLFFYLFIGFITIVYTFYDILFLEISERIMAIGIIFTLIFLATQTLLPSYHIITHLPTAVDDINIGLRAIVLSIAIIGGLYIIMLKELHEFFDIGILAISLFSLYIFGNFYGVNVLEIPIFNGLIGALGIFIFFFLQIILSGGKWMGGGDLRIAILIGLILGTTLSFPGTMLTYLIGSIIGVGFIIYSKLIKGDKTFNTQIPFGPFLALGFFTALFFQTEIQKCIEIYF